MSEQLPQDSERQAEGEVSFDIFTHKLLDSENKAIASLPIEEQGVAIIREFTKELVKQGDVEGSKISYTPEDTIDLIAVVNKREDLQKITKQNGLRAAVEGLLSDERVLRIAGKGMKEALLADILGIEKPSTIPGLAEMMNYTGDLEAEAATSPEDVMKMTDEARALAESAVSDAESSPLTELTKGLSEDDIAHLKYYAKALQSKREAQIEGDGEDSIYWERIAGQHLKDLSDRAKSISGQYVSIHNR